MPKKTVKKKTPKRVITSKAEPAIEITERQLLAAFNEDLQDAFFALRRFAEDLGEQRIYNNDRAVMFSRRVCFMFVRPKKSYLELVFFLNREEKSPPVHRVSAVSKMKHSHMIKVYHSDQVEEPITDWLREAFEATPT